MLESLGGLPSSILKLVGSLGTEAQVMVWGTDRSIWGVVVLGQVMVIAGVC